MRRSFQLLYWEGAFAMVFDTWVGPTYLSGLGGELGVPVYWVSLICSAAWIGACGQLVGAWAYERVPSYKRYTVGVAMASRGLWLLPLFFAAFWAHRGRVTGAPFPKETWFALTAGVACLSALFGASSGAAWNSWMRELVPASFRGRFFGLRQRYVMTALIGANLLASAWVDWRPGGDFAGFALLGVAAVTAASLSTWLLSRVKDARRTTEAEGARSGDTASMADLAARGMRLALSAPLHRVPSRALRSGKRRALSFAEQVKEPLRDARFRGVVIFGAGFNGAMQLASAYFPYYFTRDLHLPMSQVAFWMVLANVGCLITSGRWGRIIDQTGDPRPVLRLTATLMALSPLFYLSPSVRFVRLIAPFDYLTNGMIWVGYTVSLTTLVFRSIPGKRVGLGFSIYMAAAGLSGAACSFLGGRLAEWFLPWGGFRLLWLLAACVRLLAVWGLYRFLYARESEREGEPGELLAEFA